MAENQYNFDPDMWMGVDDANEFTFGGNQSYEDEGNIQDGEQHQENQIIE